MKITIRVNANINELYRLFKTWMSMKVVFQLSYDECASCTVSITALAVRYRIGQTYVTFKSLREFGCFVSSAFFFPESDYILLRFILPQIASFTLHTLSPAHVLPRIQECSHGDDAIKWSADYTGSVK